MPKDVLLSLFSLAPAMETVENRKNGLHTVPTACSHPLFPLWLSPHIEKSFHFYSKSAQLPWWVERSMSIRHRKTNGTWAILSSKDAPKRNIKEAQHHAVWRDAGLSLIAAIFSGWSNALLADSSFAFCCMAWECTVSQNLTRRSVPCTLHRALLSDVLFSCREKELYCFHYTRF